MDVTKVVCCEFHEYAKKCLRPRSLSAEDLEAWEKKCSNESPTTELRRLLTETGGAPSKKLRSTVAQLTTRELVCETVLWAAELMMERRWSATVGWDMRLIAIQATLMISAAFLTYKGKKGWKKLYSKDRGELRVGYLEKICCGFPSSRCSKPKACSCARLTYPDSGFMQGTVQAQDYTAYSQLAEALLRVIPEETTSLGEVRSYCSQYLNTHTMGSGSDSKSMSNGSTPESESPTASPPSCTKTEPSISTSC